jgi:hypothetical protein
MLSYPVILAVSVVGLIVFAFISYLASGSIFSVIVILMLAVLVYYLLDKFGILTINFNNGLNIDFHENVPAPATKHAAVLKGKTQPHRPIETKEVFFIEGNQFTYNDAPAVCSAYGAELATYDQIADAFAKGAEWCGYGWSQGGMALFPTQESTWNAMQQEIDQTKRTVCGRPGVNGGYFDPTLKFGVNCYGGKPANTGVKFPTPLPNTDQSAFNKLVDKWKKMLSSLKLSPFNRDVWSSSEEAKYVAKEDAAHAKSLVGTIEKDIGYEIDRVL